MASRFLCGSVIQVWEGLSGSPGANGGPSGEVACLPGLCISAALSQAGSSPQDAGKHGLLWVSDDGFHSAAVGTLG